MIHTVNFLMDVRKSDNLKNRLIRNLTEQNEKCIDIRDFTLRFDFKNQVVNISCNNPDYPFIYKCPEIVWSFYELEEAIEIVSN